MAFANFSGSQNMSNVKNIYKNLEKKNTRSMIRKVDQKTNTIFHADEDTQYNNTDKNNKAILLIFQMRKTNTVWSKVVADRKGAPDVRSREMKGEKDWSCYVKQRDLVLKTLAECITGLTRMIK